MGATSDPTVQFHLSFFSWLLFPILRLKMNMNSNQ
jgi:nitrate/nitrite transporter NarK